MALHFCEDCQLFQHDSKLIYHLGFPASSRIAIKRLSCNCKIGFKKGKRDRKSHALRKTNLHFYFIQSKWGKSQEAEEYEKHKSLKPNRVSI